MRRQETKLKSISRVSSEITDNTIVAESVLFLVAGFDTTANTLNFTLHLLAKYPKYQQIIRNELNEYISKNGTGQLTYSDIMEAPYLEAVLAGDSNNNEDML